MKLKLILLVLIFGNLKYAQGQSIEYMPGVLSTNHVYQVLEYKLSGVGDTENLRRITFDSVGREIVREEDFDTKNNPRKILKYLYKAYQFGRDEVQVTTIKEVRKFKAIAGGDFKIQPVSFSTKLDENGVVKSVLKSDSKGDSELIKYFYDNKGLPEKQEWYYNDLLKEIIFCKYLFISGNELLYPF